MLAREVKYYSDINSILDNPELIREIRENILQGDVYVVKNVFHRALIDSLIEYLAGVGRNSLPNYRAIELGSPNFHRINVWDERSYVKACFHQFVFYPWNQDIFNLFKKSQVVYQLKNLLSNNNKDKFIGPSPEEGCISRIAFQFYPKGIGGMNKHQDPVDYHQLCVPIMTMSKKGMDFKEGGAFVEGAGQSKIYLDEISDGGDVVYFNAQTPHGVEKIDPAEPIDWLSFQGRWMLLFAINKLGNNSRIENAIDLEKK